MPSDNYCNPESPEEEKSKPSLVDRYLEKYKIFCYNIGRYIDNDPREEIAKLLYQADMEMTPGMFVSMAIVTALITSIVVGIASIIFFKDSPYFILYVLLLSAFALMVVLVGFPSMLYNKISTKNMNIDQELPYALGYMSILASAGSTPLDVIRRISIEDYGSISAEFMKVIYRVDLLGEDGVSSMSYLISNTSSETFRTICIDINNTMQSGGGLKTYLEMKSDELMAMRRQAQEEFVDSLSVYGEAYMSGAVLGVVLVVLGIVVSGSLGLQLFIPPQDLFTLFVYGILPFINILILILLWMKYSRSVI